MATLQPGNRLLKQFEAFGGKLLTEVRNAGEIATRPLEARDEAGSNGIADTDGNDRYPFTTVLGGISGKVTMSNEHIDTIADQLFSEHRELLRRALRKTALNREIGADGIVVLRERVDNGLPCRERYRAVGGTDGQKADLVHRTRLFCSCRRDSQECERDQRKERLSRHHQPRKSVAVICLPAWPCSQPHKTLVGHPPVAESPRSVDHLIGADRYPEVARKLIARDDSRG